MFAAVPHGTTLYERVNGPGPCLASRRIDRMATDQPARNPISLHDSPYVLRRAVHGLHSVRIRLCIDSVHTVR